MKKYLEKKPFIGDLLHIYQTLVKGGTECFAAPGKIQALEFWHLHRHTYAHYLACMPLPYCPAEISSGSLAGCEVPRGHE